MLFSTPDGAVPGHSADASTKMLISTPVEDKPEHSESVDEHYAEPADSE